jgi:hypothetical protein
LGLDELSDGCLNERKERREEEEVFGGGRVISQGGEGELSRGRCLDPGGRDGRPHRVCEEDMLVVQ